MTDNDDIEISKDKSKEKDKKSNPIIIRKIKKHAGGHHGGSWKIAYADFVTAMMAFFLLMWLVSSLNKAQKEGLADYFKQPLKIALISGESMGERAVSAQGGGNDLKKRDGQVAAGNQPVKTDKQSAKIQDAGSKTHEDKLLEKLKTNIVLAMGQDPALADLKNQLLMDKVSDGLRIQLIDNKNQPMFPIGSDVMDPHMQEIFNKIAMLLNKMPNKVTIQGHTDGNPYQDPDKIGLTNWELSTLRANAARRALVKAGMQEDKVMEVTGFASTVLLDKTNPLSPSNRRISIIVMNKEAENKLIEKAAHPGSISPSTPTTKPTTKPITPPAASPATIKPAVPTPVSTPAPKPAKAAVTGSTPAKPVPK